MKNHCYLRKNNSYVISLLLERGIKINELDQDFNKPYIAFNGDLANSVEKNFPETIGKNYIDCGENENMFVALAALKEETDKNQWFVFKDPDFDLWLLCDEDEIDEYIYHQFLIYRYWHKATAEEIVQHFKK